MRQAAGETNMTHSLSTSPPSPARWRRLGAAALDLLLPPLCLGCDTDVAGGQTLCAACWGRIHFITAPYCACCGAPFETPVGDGMLCAGCIATPPVFARARAPMLYDDASRHLVLSFKHSDRLHPAAALAGWMLRAGADLWETADLIVPVPLHRWRLFKRRYNQAALLALRLGRLTARPVAVDALLRTRPTPTQGHLGRKEREANVKKAFKVTRRGAGVAGKHIVLVDDVLTTGATVNACSATLLAAGAARVSVLTLARVRGYA